MSPSAIVETAEQKGLDIIAICDHNSAENVAAAFRAASGRDLTVLSGMEIASQEEAHIISLFDTPDGILELQKIIYSHLPKGMAVEMNVDDQIVVNEFDEVEGFNTKLLIGSFNLLIREKGTKIFARYFWEWNSCKGEIFRCKDIPFTGLS